MDPIREAFLRIKEEMASICSEISSLSSRLDNLERNCSQNIPTNPYTPTDNPTQNPTVPQEMRGSKNPFFDVSTRNDGVPTDRPTDRKTDQQTDTSTNFNQNPRRENSFLSFERAKEVLDSLDTIKKDLRLRFKRLTNKEFLVFSTIYSLEEAGLEEITYKILATNLNLTESSIRDYTNRLFSKNIPLSKIKLNNKQISLKISPDFKQIASLQAILNLRDL
jgi:hypothetical protein